MRFRILTIALVLWATPSYAFTEEELKLQWTWTAIHIVDWLQTREIADNPRFWERSPILGKNPSGGAVDGYMAIFLVGHWLIARSLKPEKTETFQRITIGFSGTAVANNYMIGVRF